MSARRHDPQPPPPSPPAGFALPAGTPLPSDAPSDAPWDEPWDDSWERPDPDAVPLLASHDYSRLKALAHHRLGLAHPVGRLLADKLGACRVVPPDALPGSVAALGTRIILAVPGRAAESRVLVMPEDHVASGWTLPVSAPLGAALLGACAGAWVAVPARDGGRLAVHLRVVHRPSGLPRRPVPPWPGLRRAVAGGAGARA